MRQTFQAPGLPIRKHLNLPLTDAHKPATPRNVYEITASGMPIRSNVRSAVCLHQTLAHVTLAPRIPRLRRSPIVGGFDGGRVAAGSIAFFATTSASNTPHLRVFRWTADYLACQPAVPLFRTQRGVQQPPAPTQPRRYFASNNAVKKVCQCVERNGDSLRRGQQIDSRSSNPMPTDYHHVRGARCLSDLRPVPLDEVRLPPQPPRNPADAPDLEAGQRIEASESFLGSVERESAKAISIPSERSISKRCHLMFSRIASGTGRPGVPNRPGGRSMRRPTS